MLWPLFPPSVRSGGPARTAAGLLSALADEFEFSVITSAIDFLELKPMDGVTPDCWVKTFGAEAWYVSQRRPSPRHILRLIRQRDPQLVYLNSLWSVWFSMLPLLALRVARVRVPVLISPRGELSMGALRIRPWRKRFAILAYRACGIARRVTWCASTELDRADILRALGPHIDCQIAADIRADLRPPRRQGSCDREDGGLLRATFFSRISPMKNLDGLLRALSLVEAEVELTIAGPVDDPEHWRTCQKLIEALPSTKRVRVHGAVDPGNVVEFLSGFDVFVLPTHGENFGHAILEALTAGLPVIIGSRTPWMRVEKEYAGYVVNSDSPTELAEMIDRFAALTPGNRRRMSEAAVQFASRIQEQSNGAEAYRRVFLELAQAKAKPPA